MHSYTILHRNSVADNEYFVCYYPYPSYSCTFSPSGYHPYLLHRFLVVFYTYLCILLFLIFVAESTEYGK